jgi:hypothetical protein
MARQVGPIKITGTIDGITFYRMDGVYYARMKSSLAAKKVKTHPHFALTRMYAKWLGEASKLASEVYRALPGEERKYEVFCELKKLAHKRVKEGQEREVILEELGKYVMNRKERKGSQRSAKESRKPEVVSRKPAAISRKPGEAAHLCVPLRFSASFAVNANSSKLQRVMRPMRNKRGKVTSLVWPLPQYLSNSS